jgi:beta-1,4-mannosyltransferase
MKPAIRVLAAPATSLNPYIPLLYGPMRRSGVSVDQFTPWRALVKRYNILHLHWPEGFVTRPSALKAAIGSIGLILLLWWVRLRGSRVVWTTHNLASHSQRRPRAEGLFFKLFVRSIDGYICLTEGGRRKVISVFPPLGRLPGFVIPHGHYRGAYPDEISRGAARAHLGLPLDGRVILFFGWLDPYKNVGELTGVFRELRDSNTYLVIAGGCCYPEVAERLRAEADADPRIRLHLGFVPPERVQQFFRSADLVVLPFREMNNSGSILLALSFECPVLATALGALPELAQQLGDNWIRLYGSNLTAQDLEGALGWARETPRNGSPFQGHMWDWEWIVAQTINAYWVVLSRSGMGQAFEEVPRRSDL